MRKLIKHELYKAFNNNIYKIIFFVVTCFCVFMAAISIINYNEYKEYLLYAKLNRMDDIPFSAESVYNNWIGGMRGFSFFPTLFYLLIPLFTVIPNGLSFFNEAKSGYQRLLILKAGRKKWLSAKYLAIFLSSACLILIPLLINFLLVACFIPAYADPVERLSYVIKNGQAFSYLFYKTPALYTAIYLLLPSVFSGLWSCVCYMLSFFMKNQYAILFIPYVFLIFITDFAPRIYYIIMYNIGAFVETSPFYFLRASSPSMNNNAVVMAIWLGVLFLATLPVILWKGAKSDVF